MELLRNIGVNMNDLIKSDDMMFYQYKLLSMKKFYINM